LFKSERNHLTHAASVLKLMLDGVMGRVLELKHALVELEHSDFQFLDEILSELKLTPANIELPVPKFIRRENQKAIKERERVLDSLSAILVGVCVCVSVCVCVCVCGVLYLYVFVDIYIYVCVWSSISLCLCLYICVPASVVLRAPHLPSTLIQPPMLHSLPHQMPAARRRRRSRRR
jgi:hypothetical protein